MSVPAWISFLEPVLKRLAAATRPMARRELIQSVVADMHLSAEDLAERAGSTRYTKAEHRAAWALSYASMAGLVESPRRSYWKISDPGRALLARYPRGIPDAALQAIARRRGRDEADDAEEDTARVSESVSAESTPEERLEQAYRDIRAAKRDELLARIRKVEPTKFERIVLDVLYSLGYGGSRHEGRLTSAGADGGIDGIIALDRLGLDKVYVQAKRYTEDNPVSRPAVQGFLGALSERRATRGVFITTSRFSKDARDCATRSSDSLVLIDGAELAELMIDAGVGVATRKELKVVSIDEDYFEDE